MDDLQNRGGPKQSANSRTAVNQRTGATGSNLRPSVLETGLPPVR
jgi:hypothetical protein